MSTVGRYRVYLIENPAGRIYIGLTEDPTARLAQHNAGESKWTSKYRPWKLIWLSGEHILGEARKLENRLKRQKGGRGLAKLLSANGEFVSSGPGS